MPNRVLVPRYGVASRSATRSDGMTQPVGAQADPAACPSGRGWNAGCRICSVRMCGVLSGDSLVDYADVISDQVAVLFGQAINSALNLDDVDEIVHWFPVVEVMVLERWVGEVEHGCLNTSS